MGHYALSLVAFGAGYSRLGGGPKFPALCSEWALVNSRPTFPNSCSHVPLAGDGLRRFEPPRTFSACENATLGRAMDGCPSDPKKIFTKLHVNWGHGSAQQLGRVSVDSDGGNMYSVKYVDEVFEHFSVCRASEKAPRVPMTASSTVPTFNGKLQADLFF